MLLLLLLLLLFCVLSGCFIVRCARISLSLLHLAMVGIPSHHLLTFFFVDNSTCFSFRLFYLFYYFCFCFCFCALFIISLTQKCFSGEDCGSAVYTDGLPLLIDAMSATC